MALTPLICQWLASHSAAPAATAALNSQTNRRNPKHRLEYATDEVEADQVANDVEQVAGRVEEAVRQQRPNFPGFIPPKP